MKIISLASYNSGEACGVFVCIKKYFYNNNCMTDFCSYLELSLESINQLLLVDKEYIDTFLRTNNKIYLNHDNNYSIHFKNFDKMISHHDLILNNSDCINQVVEKYKRRYYRFMHDIINQDKIFFIRYGIENSNSIKYFMELIKKHNEKLKVYFINVYCNDTYKIDKSIENCYYVNFLDYIDNNITYHSDLFYRLLQYNWKPVYDIIYSLLNDKEKQNFNFIR